MDEDDFQSPYVERYSGGALEDDLKKAMTGIAYGLFILLMILVVFKIMSCMAGGGSRSCKMRAGSGGGWGWGSRGNTQPMGGGGCAAKEAPYIACEQPPLVLNPYGY